MATPVLRTRFVQPHAHKHTPEYLPSFYPGRGFLGERHARAAQLVAEVEGKLRRADQLKLYEVGWFARGEILEIGRSAGKSTLLLALGAADAGGTARVTSVDISDRRLLDAVRNLEAFGVLDRVSFVQGDSSLVVPSLPGTFDAVFVDGDHSYRGVASDIRALRGRVVPGGAVLFHDYTDPRNDDPAHAAFGVTAAVDDLAALSGWAFRGVFGATGMFEQT
jgi:protein-L-isoaspartate O-methyltransferase